MPLKASKDTKLQRETTYESSVENIVKTNTNVFLRALCFHCFCCCCCCCFLSFLVCASLLLLLRILYFVSTFIQYTAEVIPHFINNTASCFCIVRPKWFSAECFRGEWEKKGKKIRIARKLQDIKAHVFATFFKRFIQPSRVYLLWLCYVLKALNINNMYFELI